jgi:hypothetical protein
MTRASIDQAVCAWAGIRLRLPGALLALAAALPIALAEGRLGAAVDVGDASWELRYQANDQRRDRLLDLRGLNERVAGEHGWVGLDEHGAFRRGDGAPIRFWGVISGADFSPEQYDQHAAWLARIGVNLARIQLTLPPIKPGSQVTDVNEAQLDHAWRIVAAMRKQGIYVGLIDAPGVSDYNGVDMRGWGIDGYADNYATTPNAQRPWCVLFFNRRMREGYKARLKALYLRPNPYTGIPLAQDPAVAWSQIMTEDSLLWYSVNSLRKPQARELSRQFAAWLGERYGSIAKARALWSGETLGNDQLLADDPASDQIGLYNIWEATAAARAKKGPPSPGKARRLADQVEFLAWTMHEFNVDMSRFLREDLGCKGLVLADNWKAADASLMDAERWSYLPGDMMAENRFFGCEHVGSSTGWRVSVGDRFRSASALKLEELADYPPFAMKKVDGRAGCVTATGWTVPNRYQSEGPLLCAAYGLLDGMDGFVWEGFRSQPELDTSVTLRINPETTWLEIWNLARPPLATAFPAAAVLFRNGYLRRGETAVHERRPVADLWTRKPQTISDHGPPAAAPSGDASDPLAFFVGPVSVAYGDMPAAVETQPALSSCIDRDHRLVRSNSGELQLDYGKGVCRITAPKAQGALGFLAGQGPIDLGDVTIASDDAYATILVVPLDDQPIAISKRLLIQSCTTAEPSGWTTKPASIGRKGQPTAIAAEQVVSLGGPPWRVACNRSTITIRNRGLRSAVAVDAMGFSAGEVPCTTAAASLTLEMPSDRLYVIVTGPP